MKKIFTLIAFLIITVTVTWGQINTLYFNKNIYQSTDLNPARQHDCRFSFGLPALSSIYLNTKHTGFAFSDIVNEDETKPYSERFVFDIEGMYETMGDLNYVFLHNKTTLGYVAFWVRDFHVTLGADLNIQQNITYPKSMFLLKDGNYFEDEEKYISFTGFAEDFNVYTAYAVGVSKEVAPGLTIGGKIKLLKGIANFTTENFQFDWHVATEDTAIYDYSFNTAFEFRASTPFKIVPSYNAEGIVSGVDEFSEQYINEIEALIDAGDYMGLTKSVKLQNTGFGIDFGVIYKPNDMFELSASVLDFGFINWKTNPMIIKTAESEFIYSGFDLAKYIGGFKDAITMASNPEIQDSIINQITTDMLDTLIFLSKPSFDSTKYRTNLNTRLHFGAAFTPADWVTIGVLYNGYFYHKKLISSYTASTTLMFWKGWSYSLSYTMFKHSFNNVGMGVSYKIGPFQTYILMNNLSVPMLGARFGLNPEKPYNEGIATNWVKGTQMFDFQFGINFMFGCRDRRDFGVLD